MRQATYSAQDLAAMSLPCLPGTERNIRARAKREEWTKTYTKIRGGYQYQYLSGLLPDEVKTAITMYELKRDGNLTLTVASQLPVKALQQSAKALNLCEAQLKNALAKADIVRLYEQWVDAAVWGKKDQARTDFLLAYEGGAWPVLKDLLGEVSWKTIERWKGTIKTHGDALHLAERRGYAKRGQSVVTPEQTKILLACVLHPNRPRIAESIRMARMVMQARGIASGHTESTYRRWLDRWISTNNDVWVFNREGAKAWNDKCAFYIERDLNLVNVGDVIIADGHNLNFEIINPWTGKRQNHMTLVLFYDMRSSYPLGWEIMPTENTQSISSALRRAIIRLGKIPQVVYLDNGRAFKSKFFQGSTSFDEAGYAGLYERLGIKTIFAWPYHGQSKPIERFFGTFAEAERLNALSYTGTSIDNKPARMMRGEKLHRAVHQKAFGDRCLTLEEAHVLIAAWFDEYANREQTRHSHLKGLRPGDVFNEGRGPGVDIEALNYLMMSLEIKTIHRNGITFRGQNYYAPALAGRKHQVTIRYDLQDDSSLLVYDTNGEFICQALPVQKIHPAAAHLGTEADVANLTQQIEYKRHQEKGASSSAREFLRDVILPENQRQLERMGVEAQVGEIGAKKSQLKQIAAPISEVDYENVLAEAEQMGARQQEDDAEQLRKSLSQMSEPNRYEKLIEMQVQGILLCEEWRAFIRYFRTTQAFERSRDYYEEYEAKMAMVYGLRSENG